MTFLTFVVMEKEASEIVVILVRLRLVLFGLIYTYWCDTHTQIHSFIYI